MSIYESLKADLDYLGLPRAAEVFGSLATEAKTEGWSHVEYLAKVMAEQSSATVNRRLAACATPASRRSARWRTSTSTSSHRRPQAGRRPGDVPVRH
jgi:hypothetical protein